MATFLAVLIAVSLAVLVAALAKLTRPSGPARLPARVTVPARAGRLRRRR
ncbi:MULTISPECIES: hypothetical protein [Anaeromyxobacter]|nr:MULTISPECIES: hypothetical protein [unclassified Anaeromyxobacter]